MGNQKSIEAAERQAAKNKERADKLRAHDALVLELEAALKATRRKDYGAVGAHLRALKPLQERCHELAVGLTGPAAPDTSSLPLAPPATS